jgi:hypothetical protein
MLRNGLNEKSRKVPLSTDLLHPPIRVEITNASELQKDTVLRIQRDGEGKLAGATAVKV